jgi:FtsP/CotA-like multicopper oxidase with cupredoxin domain
MKRANFIRAGAGTMLLTSLPPLSRAAQASDLVEHTLAAAPLNFSPVTGLNFPGRAFNGSIPGPLLRVVHGQRLRATFVNRSGSPATIHWHGMILPNDMDGVQNVTQPAVPDGGSFVYEFAPGPPGTRWYHDHVSSGLQRGMFGLFIVDDPSEVKPDAEFALVFHDVPSLATISEAMRGVSAGAMVDPFDSPELRDMTPGDKMGDEVAYVAHCINGASYPATKPLAVEVGQRIRLRVLNANFTQTRYIRLAGHRLTVTHADGNPLAQPLEVDALRIGVAERYDASFEITKPGAWLLQGLSSDPMAYQQAVVVHTPGYENATPLGSPQSLAGLEYFTYAAAGGASAGAPDLSGAHAYAFTLGGGKYGSSEWTIDGQTYPNTPRIHVSRNDIVTVRFTNKTDMDHPMHLHGHVFEVVEVDGRPLARPLAKDTSLVGANGGTLGWRFTADAPPGRWLLHCHNDIHMMDGMMTEVIYGA